jgi:mRNA interferase RelE/StbE
MSRYQMVFSKTACKDIDKLDKLTKQRIAKKLEYFLGQDNTLSFAKQLIDSKLGTYRFRVGHYRVVFDIEGDTIEVLAIKHRKDVYKS